MALSENSSNMVMPVGPVGGYSNGFGFGGDGSFWIIVLFLFAMMGGWNNGIGFGGGNGFMPYMFNNANNDVQRGFDQSAVISGINGVQQSLTSGFAAAESAEAARQMANMQQTFNLQTAIDNRLDTIAMNQQNCCCENRAAIAGVQNAIAQDGAATRTAIANANQNILDKLCQLELDGIKQNYENRISGMQSTIDSLRSQVTAAGNAASQAAQTSAILADNAKQTQALEQYLNPTPIPAYMVQNPNCCGNNWANNFNV